MFSTTSSDVNALAKSSAFRSSNWVRVRVVEKLRFWEERLMDVTASSLKELFGVSQSSEK